MVEPLERRKVWSRIVGVERRAAPLPDLEGRPLPDPTLLEDEEFEAIRHEPEAGRKKVGAHRARGDAPPGKRSGRR